MTEAIDMASRDGLCIFSTVENPTTNPHEWCRYMIRIVGGPHKCGIGRAEIETKGMEEGKLDKKEDVRVDFMANIWTPLLQAVSDDIDSMQSNYERGVEISQVIRCIHGYNDKTARLKIAELALRIRKMGIDSK